MVSPGVVTQQENQISEADLALIKQLCLPNKIIKQNMGIVGRETVSMRLTRLAAKLGVENRTAIVVKALGLGLVTIDQLVLREFNGKTDPS